MPGGTKNLGIVKAIFAGSSAPVNTVVIWYDTVNFIHKYFNGTAWVALNALSSGTISVDMFDTINGVADYVRTSLVGMEIIDVIQAQGFVDENDYSFSVDTLTLVNIPDGVTKIKVYYRIP
mgnify:CR=1 FL=1